MNKNGKIETILNSLDGVRRASPGYYFFTQVQERLNRTRSFAEGIIRFISRPAVAAAAVLIILLINGYAVFNSVHKSTRTNTSAAVSEIASVDEYSQLNTFSFSDVEKMNP